MYSRNTQLTHNFNLKEFIRPQDPLPSLEVILNIHRLAERLQVIRDIVDKPITITSGYRTPAHNAEVGGEPNSQHLLGKAADIVVIGMTAKKVQKVLKNWSGGLGSYSSFTHVDIRPNVARWNG